MKKLCDFERGYLAAMIDQYATLLMMKCTDRTRRNAQSIKTCLRIYAKKAVRDRLLAMMPGAYMVDATNKRHDQKKTFAVNVSAQGALADLLEQVGPLLATKAPHARLMVSFCRSRQARGKRPEPYSPEEFALYDAFQKLPRDRKRRGYKSDGMC